MESLGLVFPKPERSIRAKQHEPEALCDFGRQANFGASFPNGWPGVVRHHRLDKRVRENYARRFEEASPLGAESWVTKPESRVVVAEIAFSDCTIYRNWTW